jgi:hypothetical protein
VIELISTSKKSPNSFGGFLGDLKKMGDLKNKQKTKRDKK